MDKLIALLKAHLGSWTMKLGAIAGILVAIANAVPQVQSVVHAIWPAGDAYLVVAAMYLGRLIGFVKALQTAAQ